MSYWRERAESIIAQVIGKHGHDPVRLKQELFNAYPFGQRKYWPYKVWLSEIRRQLKTDKPKVDPNQTKMF